MRAILGPLVFAAILFTLWVTFFSGNPGGISDERYARYKRLAPPKLLYSCTMKPTSEALLQQTRECAKSGRAGCEQKSYEAGEAETENVVEFVGGDGTATYNDLLRAATATCAQDRGNVGNGKIAVLESQKK